MMKVTGKIADVAQDFVSGKMRITFEVNESQALKAGYDELHNLEKLSIKVEKYREKRSLNANSYMWVLCAKLAEERSKDGKKVTKEDVYRDEIKDMNIFRDYENLPMAEAKTLQTAWGMLGTGWITEQVDYAPDGDTVTIRCYYGSSQYSTKQMSRLIDNIVQDCKALDIVTLTPAELAGLVERWGNNG